MTTWTGRRIRDARARKTTPEGRPWTQADLAQAIGASPRSVASWERDEARPQTHWIVKLDELFADVTPTDDTASDLNNPRIKDAATSELLAEVLARVVAQERTERSAEPPIRWAARAREADPPERVQFRSADAPSANREKDSGAGSAHRDEAQ